MSFWNKIETLQLLMLFCCFLQGCASKPGDTEQQAMLKQAAEELRAATGVAAGSAMKKSVIRKLEVQANIVKL